LLSILTLPFSKPTASILTQRTEPLSISKQAWSA